MLKSPMALTASTVQCLSAASFSGHGLPSKLGQALWSSCQRVTSSRSIWTSRSGFLNSPPLWKGQYRSVHSLGRPYHLRCNAQSLMATNTTPPSPEILLGGIRRLHSDIPGKGPEIFTQRAHGTASDDYKELVNSIRMIIDGKSTFASGTSSEPATKADSTNPNTSSSSSKKSNDTD